MSRPTRHAAGGQTALRFLEQVWNRDLDGGEPDGPLPEAEALDALANAAGQIPVDL